MVMFIPVCVVLLGIIFEHFLECFIRVFDQAICLRVVGVCFNFLNAK